VGVGAARGRGVVALPARAAEGDRDQAAVAPEDLAERQLVLAPPLHVGRIAEGAHHEDAGALLGSARALGKIGKGTWKSGVTARLPKRWR